MSKSQSVSLLQAYLLLELFSSSLLAETGGKCPLVFSVTRVAKCKKYQHQAGGISEGAKVKIKSMFMEHTNYAHLAIVCTNGTANIL